MIGSDMVPSLPSAARDIIKPSQLGCGFYEREKRVRLTQNESMQ